MSEVVLLATMAQLSRDKFFVLQLNCGMVVFSL